ncbi:hypothetical protein Rsub_01687 [Raphidocelis subcapitata]|uniref:Uncharacterized protein n=1 Tax=Raphidocelis subcapitata TaxID=307507 RepID=A0A2V0NMP6_9CHLO|nr:hypothetical protein Rsub_01687 [Raphidocelis subcapitata]|eukprot:GBF88786.1 hypothetical protein Rsub_01687 [Raphidocelis subcapitata]
MQALSQRPGRSGLAAMPSGVSRIPGGRLARPVALARPGAWPRRALSVAASSGLTRPAGEDTSGMDSAPRGGPAGIGPFMSVPAAGIVARGGGAAPGDMGGDVSSRSALGAVLERHRVNIIMPSPPQSTPKLDDGGSGGGLGKNNHNGGGGGDGGGDDDDDFFGEEGDGEGGDGSGGGARNSLFRIQLPELFDRAAIAAVLQEWFKTIADLPLFIRRSVEMGLFSSAQMVRFLAMDVRPNVTREVSRRLPTAWAREFVGRLMADPAFVQKLVIEQALAFTASMLHEWRVRGESFRSELDLALINSMGLAAAVGATVWVTAPSRAIGAVHKFPWQRMLAGLPHCVFDASGPLRSYTPAARVGGFFASMAQLSAVGAAAGAATAGASAAAVAARRRADPAFEPSVPVPEVGRSSAGLGAFFALNANARYQLLGGLDRYLFGHASALWGYVAASGVARLGGAALGEASRPWWQGLATETHPSHLVERKRVRKVRRRVVKKAQAAPAAEEQQQQAGAAAALALAAAGGSSDAALAALAAGAAAAEQQHRQQQRAAGGAPAAAAAVLEDASGEASGSGASALEAEVEGRLQAAPALMGSPEGLAALARSQSFSGSAMGEALRDAVGTEAEAVA